MPELEKFIEQWEDANGMKSVFLRLKEVLESQDGANLDFNARPGVSYSLRASHPAQKDRPLYAMVDVVDDDPAQRWLSVCFYEDMIQDPRELGDMIPEGLLGQDGYCFDADEPDQAMADYLAARIGEAYASASR